MIKLPVQLEKSLRKNDAIIFFKGEKEPLFVKDINDRFIICVKPIVPVFTKKSEKISHAFAIMDRTRGIAGPTDYEVNPFDFSDSGNIAGCMHQLLTGICEVSDKLSSEAVIDRDKTEQANLEKGLYTRMNALLSCKKPGERVQIRTEDINVFKLGFELVTGNKIRYQSSGDACYKIKLKRK